VNEDGMSRRKPRNDAEAKDLMVWSESKGPLRLSRLEDLRSGRVYYNFIDHRKGNGGTYRHPEIPARLLPIGDPGALF
jgi:hypothetical protein